MGRVWKSSPSPTGKTFWEIFLPALPGLLWAGVAVVALLIFHQQLGELLQRTTKLKALGVEIEAVERKLDRSVASLQRVPDQGIKLRLSHDDPLRAALIQRWEQMRISERGLRILLIHDRIVTAKALRDPFAQLGITVDIGICGAEAQSLLTRHRYDVVISDINWKKCPPNSHAATDGVSFLQYAHKNGFAQPTVFYIENLDQSRGTPPYAAGITNNWYEVLHYMLDVVSRTERPLPSV
jgi:CheY-like chemotaxis protein